MTYIGKVLGGKVILPSDAVLPDGTTVRVEPVNGNETAPVDLRSRGITRAQAAELRARLGAFAEDWDSPEMDLYSNYDAHNAKL